jgi:hypothetical protein
MCDARNEPQGCLSGSGSYASVSDQNRWRCTGYCDFDYCDKCHASKLNKSTTENCDGIKTIPALDGIHTHSMRHYCGRTVGRDGYAAPCMECSGRCGPSEGCQCRACFKLDFPQLCRACEQQPISHSLPTVFEESAVLPDGTFFQLYGNNDRYVGDMNGGRRHGAGTYTFAANGISIPARWSNDKIEDYLSHKYVWWYSCSVNASMAFLFCNDGVMFLKCAGRLYRSRASSYDPDRRHATAAFSIGNQESVTFDLFFAVDFKSIERGQQVNGLPDAADAVLYNLGDQTSEIYLQYTPSPFSGECLMQTCHIDSHIE